MSNLQPSVFFVQETKFRTNGKLKTENSDKYYIYELIRKDRAGGGIAIGVHKDLDPVWVNEGIDGVELLTVEVSFSDLKVRCICGYGPQESEAMENKDKFWIQLCLEVEEALNSDRGIVIEMDGNLWAVPELIPGDPNQINNNGRMLKKFLEKYPNLSIVNSMNICKGLITRSRTKVLRNEKSVIDFFIVCVRMKYLIEKMIVDEKKNYALTRYFKKNGVNCRKDIDHNTLVLDMKITIEKMRKERTEVFNFRNSECQKVFHQITNQSEKLINCFDNNQTLSQQCNKWFKEFNSIFHQSFKKIRMGGKIKETEFSSLMKRKN